MIRTFLLQALLLLKFSRMFIFRQLIRTLALKEAKRQRRTLHVSHTKVQIDHNCNTNYLCNKYQPLMQYLVIN